MLIKQEAGRRSAFFLTVKLGFAVSFICGDVDYFFVFRKRKRRLSFIFALQQN